MSKAKIIGVKRLDFEMNGEKIKGYSLFIAEQVKGTFGLEGNKVFKNDDDFSEVYKAVAGDVSKLVNRDADVIYNKKGKVEDIRLIG